MRHWALDQVSVLGAFIAEPSLLYSALAWPDIWHLCFPPACTVVLPLLRSGSPREGEREGAAGISKLPLFSGLRSDGINQLASTSKSFHIQEVSPPGVHCPSFHRLLESAGAKQNQKAPLGSKACLLGNPQLCGFSACSQVIHVLGENSQSRLFGDNRRCQLWSFAPSELGCALNIQPLILLGSYEVATICILWRRKLRLRESLWFAQGHPASEYMWQESGLPQLASRPGSTCRCHGCLQFLCPGLLHSAMLSMDSSFPGLWSPWY